MDKKPVIFKSWKEKLGAGLCWFLIIFYSTLCLVGFYLLLEYLTGGF